MAEGHVAILVVGFLWTAFIPLHRTEDACPKGWFGHNCSHLCHCNLDINCYRLTGLCPQEEPCMVGWIGPSCQYADLVQESLSANSPQFLRDRKKTTCNPDPDSTSLNVSLYSAFRVTWFRIYTDIDMSFYDLQVQLDGSDCPDKKIYRVASTVLDISCDAKMLVTQLTLRGPTVAHICDIEISGGRNLALKQEAKQSSHEYLEFGYGTAPEAVDGCMFNYFMGPCCSHTGRDKPDSWWSLTFSNLTRLSRVLIWNQGIGQIYSYQLDLFYTSMTTPEVTLVSPHKKQDTKISFDVPREHDRVKSFKISFSKTEAGHDLMMGLCEVQAFGDLVCPEGMFGLFCQETCKCDPGVTCSQVTGRCPLPCVSSPSVGADSGLLCYPNCLKTRCGEDTCVCVTCAAGHLGVNCEEDCPSGKHGYNCSQDCSRNCLDSKCNASTGHCLVCRENGIMPLCKTAEGEDLPTDDTVKGEFNWFWLLFLLLLIPVVVLLWCCFLRRKEKPPEPEATPAPPAPAANLTRVEESVQQVGSSVDLEVTGSEAETNVASDI